MRPNTAQTPGVEAPRSWRFTEYTGVLLLLTVFFAANLLTANRYPFAWIDEVMYSDPAVNLLLGNGFTSTAWYAQTSDEFWAGNVPLHSFLLYGWMKLFGFSITAVRSINLLYVAASCWLIWRFSLRTGLVPSPRLRACWIFLALCGYSVIFSYRSGRPDCLCMLLVCSLCYASTLRHPRTLPILFFLAALAPWTGLQLLPLLAVGGTLLLIFLGKAFLPRLLALWSGVAAGLATLVWFYHFHGVWPQFLRSVRQHTSNRLFEMLFGGDFRHSNITPKDFSFVPIFLAAVFLLWVLWRQGKFKVRSPLAFGLAYSILLSLALLFGGKFPTYYGWMTYLPLSFCVCATLAKTPVPGLASKVVWGLIGLAALAGVTLHGVTALYNWSDRDCRKVVTFIDGALRESDYAYVEFGAYYAAKSRAANLFTYYYLEQLKPREKDQISVLVIRPDHLEEVTKVIGGAWTSTGESLVPRRDSLFGNNWKPMGFLSMEDNRFEVFRRR